MTKTGRINLITDAELVDQAKAIANVQGVTLSELIVNLLRRHIERNADLLQEYYDRQKRVKME